MDFEVKVAHDDEHAVWYVRESTIPGLHAEAPTYDALVEIIREIAPVLALENSPSPEVERVRSVPLRIEHIVDMTFAVAH